MYSKRKLAAVLLPLLVLFSLLSGCGAGGAGSGGLVTYNPSTATTPPPVTTFNVTAGDTYTFRATSVSGDFWFLVYDTNPYGAPTPTPINFAYVYSGYYRSLSFVATSTQTLYLVTAPTSYAAYTYSLNTIANQLTVGATAVSGKTDSDTLYYSFDAQSGKSYEVYLTPSKGNVDIGAVSASATLSPSFGSSTRSGTQTDRVGFTASTTGRHYIKITSPLGDTNFTIGVREIGTQPDLEVVITSANSDGINLNLNYTVYNNGLTASGSFRVDAWADLASPPVFGATGDGSQTLSSIAAYGSTSGSFSIPTSAASGTAYMTVDSASAVTEADETNNTTAGEAWVATEPDLQVTIQNVYADGTNVRIDYRVDNTGSRNAGAFAVDFWADAASAPVPPATGDTSTAFTSLTAGSYTTGSVTIANTSASGTAYAVVDTLDAVNESNESNNVTAAAPWVITYPDLSVVIDSVSSNGSELTINYTATNGPGNYVGSFDIDFWDDSSGSPGVGSAGVTSVTEAGGLAPNGTVSGTVKVPSLLASGTAYAIVDTANAVTESNESNNVSPGSSWTASYPDLRVVVERVIADGTNAKINIEIYNQGAADAGSFDVEVWSDLASAPAVGDTGTTTEHFDFSAYPLPPGAYTSRTVTIPTTATTGTAYALVDTANAIPESDETNNVSAASVWALTYESPDASQASPISVPDNDLVTGASASITLTGVTSSLSKAVVGINVWHTYLTDIDVYLESPTGTWIELTTDNGCSGNYGDSTTDALFDDAAAYSIIGTPDCYYTGVYRPEQPLSGLAGEDANGTWILHVYDDTAGYTGTLRHFTLSVQ